MKTAVSSGSLLLLGLAWMTHSCLSTPESLIQDDFDLGRFMGQWYEIAVVSTCTHYMHRKRGTPVIVALDLQHVAPERNFTITATTLRNGTCKPASTVYSLTDLPGKFFHYIPRFSADVYSYVLDTNYDHYAVMLLMSTEQPSGNKSTTLKLFSRTVDVSPAVLDDFQALVRQHRLSHDIIMNKDVCQPVMEPNSQPPVQPSLHATISVSNESKSNVVPSVDSENV